MQIVHDRFSASAFVASVTPFGRFVGLLRAVPARERPITIAMLPVMVGGSTFSIASCPNCLMIIPAAMETSPERTMPNCAAAIFSSATGPANAFAPVMEQIAVMYEKLDP